MEITRIQKKLSDCTINRERVVTYIANHGSITPLLAFSEWGETRLATYIQDLRDEGWGITSYFRVSDSGKRFTEYTFTTQQQVLVDHYGIDATPVYQGPAPVYSRFMHQTGGRKLIAA